jgi:hypothetical protein
VGAIKIGKNAIENLTIGMYEDSKIIYREYIQNAADSIDNGLKEGLFHDEDPPYIDISIDDASRTVRIKDNAVGIKKSEVHNKLADVADSDKKKGVDKGFRGIGRLGGLAYCETLHFKTTYYGEAVQTIMTWDADELIRMLNDEHIKYSAAEVLSKVISYDEKPCSANDHFFTVELENIRKENNELLDVAEVKRYISANAPVAFSNKFYFRSKIKQYLDKNGLTLPVYRVFVEGEDVFKDYNTNLYESLGNQKKKFDEIYDLEFKEFKNSQNELLAWMWFGISTFQKQIPVRYNDMRGIRLRKDNIQIGNSGTLNKLFKESRGNYYFIGELHAVHKELIPNARRDYFNENKARVEFEEEVKGFFHDKLHSLYYDSNKAKNALRKEVRVVERRALYAQKIKKGFVNPDEQMHLKSGIKDAERENKKAKRQLAKLKEKSKNDKVLAKVIDLIEKKHCDEVGNKTSTTSQVTDQQSRGEQNKKPKPALLVDKLHRLNREQRKLMSRVYGVINRVLPPELSESLIEKIQNELNK